MYQTETGAAQIEGKRTPVFKYSPRATHNSTHPKQKGRFSNINFIMTTKYNHLLKTAKFKSAFH